MFRVLFQSLDKSMRPSKLNAESIRKVLQLRIEAKSVGVISKALKMSKSTVHKVITYCDSILDSQKLHITSNDEIFALVYKNEKVEPDFEKLYYRDENKKVSVKKLYRQYQKQVKGKAFGYTTFIKKYNNWLKSSFPREKTKQYGMLNCEYVILENAALDTKTGELQKAVVFFAQQTLTDNILVGICNKNDYSTLYAMLVYACRNANEAVQKVNVRFHNSVFNSINNDLAANFQSLQDNKIQIVKRVSRRSKSPLSQVIGYAQAFTKNYYGKISSFCTNFISYCQEQGYMQVNSSINEITNKAILESKSELPLTRLKTFKVNKAQLTTIPEFKKIISLPMEFTGKKVRVAYDDNRAIARTPDSRTVIHHFTPTDNSYLVESIYSSLSSKYYINPEHIPVTECELKSFGDWIPTSLSISKDINNYLHTIVSELLNETDMPQRHYSLVNYLINKSKGKPEELLGNTLKEWIDDERTTMHELISQLDTLPCETIAFD